jgi:hypothetical protein
MTQTETLLAALKRGEALTPIDALTKYGCLALSQRMTPLIRAGYPIRSELVAVGRKKVARYSWAGQLALVA